VSDWPFIRELYSTLDEEGHPQVAELGYFLRKQVPIPVVDDAYRSRLLELPTSSRAMARLDSP
jgi:hypothetical protein